MVYYIRNTVYSNKETPGEEIKINITKISTPPTYIFLIFSDIEVLLIFLTAGVVYFELLLFRAHWVYTAPMEIMPKDAFDDGVRFPSLEEDIELSPAALRARQALKRQNFSAKATRFKREHFLDAIAATFEELGGAPRLIEWADQNYGDFATKLLGKTLTPAINQLAVNASGPVQIVCPIGRSALDDTPELTSDGKEIKELPDAKST